MTSQLSLLRSEPQAHSQLYRVKGTEGASQERSTAGRRGSSSEPTPLTAYLQTVVLQGLECREEEMVLDALPVLPGVPEGKAGSSSGKGKAAMVS